MWCEKGLNVELSAWRLFTETFGIDAAWHCSVLEDLDHLLNWSIVQDLWKRLNPLNASVIISKPENG